MGQVETKVFEGNPPPWDEAVIKKRTELSEGSIRKCWKTWRSSKSLRKGKLTRQGFVEMFNIQGEQEDEAKKLFKLLDRDNNDKIDFTDLMLFLYAMDEDLSSGQHLKRAFRIFDRNDSGQLSKAEMIEAFKALELIEGPRASSDSEEEGKAPHKVENMFSLMDFRWGNEDFINVTIPGQNMRV